MLAHHLATSNRFVVVEQLNHTQWHAVAPLRNWSSTGVADWASTVANALWMAKGRGLGVEQIDLDYNRIVLQWPDPSL